MAKEDKYGLRELQTDFPDTDACLEYLFDTLHSRKCSCGGTYARLKGRLQFQCSKCRFQIAPCVGTIFEKSSTPLTLWFHAIFIFSNAKSGISAKEMERQLNVTYKTAWRILTLIRKSLKQNTTRLNGDVEMDEGYFGGKGNGGPNNELLGFAMKKKAVVIAAKKRGGDIRAKVFKDAKSETIGKFLFRNVGKTGTRLLTDESNRYDKVAKGYNRHSVNHSHKEFTRGDVHVNNVEAFWSHVKRSVKGTHKVISKKYLQAYLDGFVFHWNNARKDRERFDALLGAIVV